MGKLVSAYIRELRAHQSISIRELGGRTEFSPSYLSLVERERRTTSIAALYRIVRALGGDFRHALRLLALDAGVPEEVIDHS